MEAAIAAASAGDTIQVTAGSYTGTYVTINKNLTIVGSGNPTITYNGGVGPYIQLSGDNVNVSISGLTLVGNNVNTTILGDTNIAYGAAQPGVNEILHLTDVSISNSGGSAIYAVKPTASYDIKGGTLAAPNVVVAAAQFSIAPSGSGGTLINETVSDAVDVFNLATGYLSVIGATFSVGSYPAIQLESPANVNYVAFVNDSFNATTKHLVVNGGADLTASLPASPAYVQIVNGAVVVIPTLTPDQDGAHWLPL
jgi:hypothetical protein